jgi:hypothetical protein
MKGSDASGFEETIGANASKLHAKEVPSSSKSKYTCHPERSEGGAMLLVESRKQVRTTQSVPGTWQTYKVEAERRLEGEFRV